MKSETIIIIITGIMITFFLSCTKTITPSLNNESQLVIVGTVSDTTGPYHVYISKTANFYSGNIYPTVSGATVHITDITAGVNDILTESAAGDYVTHTLTGVPGHTYQMQVYLNGQTYTAISTMPQPVRLDSVTVDYSQNNDLRPVVNYQDPEIKNYYKYDSWCNGIQVKHFETFDDRLSNGRYLHRALDADTGKFHRGDLVRVDLVGIDYGAFSFLSEAESVAFNNGSLAAPATPVSNISGGCVGYFSVQTVSTRQSIIK
ncbi:MAG: DUF4249 domain-containing protein [Bacteroidota bacterium]|nr:DUF4249 domain-containing protein [Bacteroidota bacterium]